MIGDEFTGIYTDGMIGTVNGAPWIDPETFLDARDYFKTGDVVKYPETGREFRVSFVDEDTVKMVVTSELAGNPA